MAQRKKFAVYGSCQAPALAKMLNSCPAYVSEWELVDLEPCFVASEERIDYYAKETLPSLDLFIYQPVSDSFRGPKFSSTFLRSCLPPGSPALSVQYLHWEGYYPTVNSPYGLPPHPEGYVDALVAGAMAMGIGRDSFVHRLEEIGASLRVDANEIGAWCGIELKSREAGENDGGKRIDVVMTDFIVANWRKDRLFYTMNHPTARLLREVATQCMMKLGYAQADIYFDPALDPLDVTKVAMYPIYRDDFGFFEAKRMSDFQLLYKLKPYGTYFEEQFQWFERSPLSDVAAFFERLATSHPWLKSALHRAF